MTALAGSMRRKGFSERAIVAALLEENAARCRPPLDEIEVRRTAHSVARYAPQDAVNGNEWKVLTGDALASKLPPVNWLCRELGIAPGAPTLVAGSNDSGKTMALQALALAVATSQPLWGRFEAKSGKVLHVDYEQGRYVTQMRYQRMAMAHGLWRELWQNLEVVTLPPAHLDTDGSLTKLEQLCEGHILCIIDSLKAAFPSAEENSSDVRKWLDALLPISERTGCTFIVIHHTRKPSKDAMGGTKMNIRGSSAISDACASIISIVGTETKHRRLVVHEKARITGNPVEQFTLTTRDVSLPVEQLPADVAEATHADLMANETGSLRFGLTVEAGTVEEVVSSLEDKVREFVSKNPECGVREIRFGVVGNDNQISAALKELVRAGSVVESVGWRGKKTHRVVHVEREPGDDSSEWSPEDWDW
jgi:hypothetical protein